MPATNGIRTKFERKEKLIQSLQALARTRSCSHAYTQSRARRPVIDLCWCDEPFYLFVIFFLFIFAIASTRHSTTTATMATSNLHSHTDTHTHIIITTFGWFLHNACRANCIISRDIVCRAMPVWVCVCVWMLSICSSEERSCPRPFKCATIPTWFSLKAWNILCSTLLNAFDQFRFFTHFDGSLSNAVHTKIIA